MKKIAIVISAVVMLSSLSALVFAETPANKRINDIVYKGEKWAFDFGIPKNETLVILPQDRKQPRVYGSGYVGRVKNDISEYNIILANNDNVYSFLGFEEGKNCDIEVKSKTQNDWDISGNYILY